MFNMYTCMWIGKSFSVIAVLKHFGFFFVFFFYLKGKFYFQTFKHVKVKLATNWFFLFTVISF